MASVLVSCANIGRPSGGPRDETPPVYVSSNPEPNQLNFSGSKITINFNEYIQLKDQTTKVVVSPAQKNMPIIRANGKSVSVELRDTLLPNTTYCIDFADAIQDNNESNPLNDFAFAFSTGDSIDSLQVSGIMLRASDLEPMQGIIVGIHENLNDSAFSSIPLTRIARTNDYGQFTIRNMKPGSYHLFGLKDMDGNYTFSRNEDMAFIDEIIIPSSHQRETTDTVFKFNGESTPLCRACTLCLHLTTCCSACSTSNTARFTSKRPSARSIINFTSNSRLRSTLCPICVC